MCTSTGTPAGAAGPSPPSRRLASLPGLALLLCGSQAWAGYPSLLGPRALGMGGALRATAEGDAGPFVNPAGMSLSRTYTLGLGYQLDTKQSAHRPYVVIADSTSALGIAGGVSYNYLSAKPADGVEQSGHQATASLSFPFGEKFAVGGTLKYLNLTTETEVPGGTAQTADTDGFTFDVGAVVRPIDQFALGAVGYNLADKKTPLASQAVGFGLAVKAVPKLTVAADAVVDFTTWDQTRGNVWSFMGGAEFLTPNDIGIRLGGGHDGVREAGYIAGGISAVTEVGALDLAIHRDLSGTSKTTIFLVGARVFVPAADG